MLTIPRSVFKSSTKDLSFPIFEIAIQRTLHYQHLSGNAWASQFYDVGARRLYRYSRYIRKGEYRRFPAWILT